MTTNREDVAKGGSNEDEIMRLAGSPPLKTLLKLMIGPLASQITSTLYGIINTIWISKYVGEVGMAAVALDIAWEGIARGFGLFLSVAASTQISSLFGKGLFDEANQVVCDLLRVAIICGIIVPAILLPINKPLSRWFGANEETVDEAFQYILPQCAGNFLTCIFLTNVGFLQAEGRTLLVGCIDFIAMGVGMCALNPIFLGVIKTGVAGPSYSTIIADGVPGIILTILFFKGKFGLKPDIKGLLKPFSPHTKQAIYVGSSQLVAQISICLPGIIVRKLIGLSVANTREYDLAMAGFNVLCRYYNITTCVVLALTTGFVAAASYAYSSQNYARYLRLSIHLNWVATVWCVVTGLIAVCIPAQISTIFGSGTDFLLWSEPMLRINGYSCFVTFACYTFQSMLQALQSGFRAIVISFMSNIVMTIVGVYILYFTNRHDAVRLMYVYIVAYGFGLVFGAILLIGPLINVIKLYREKIKYNEGEEVSDPNKKEIDAIAEL